MTKRNTVINIEINGVEYGKLDPQKLTLRTQYDLEKCAGFVDLLEWLKKYAGTTDEQADALLDNVPLTKAGEVGEGLRKALDAAMSLPN
jgi:hypothetical protein